MTPQDFNCTDVANLTPHLKDFGEYLEAVNVIAGFNFANRIADALDVPLEIPNLLRRNLFGLRFTRAMMSIAMRWRMPILSDTPRNDDSQYSVNDVQSDLANAGMPSLPKYFSRLGERPHILQQHASSIRKLLLESELSPELILQVGASVGASLGDQQCVDGAIAALHLRGIAPWCTETNSETNTGGTLQRAVWSFSNSVTSCADRTTSAQIDSLRQAGFSDRQILDLSLLVAGYNASARLNIALTTAYDEYIVRGGVHHGPYCAS